MQACGFSPQIYNDYHLESCQSDMIPPEGVFGIEHCCEGKIEWEMANGDFAYMGVGSLMPCDYSDSQGQFSFPLKSYKGATLQIQMPEARQGLPEGFPMDLTLFRNKVLSSGIRNVSGSARAAYVFGLIYEARNQSLLHKKLAVLELLLLLNEFNWEGGSFTPLYFPGEQVRKIKEMEKRMSEDLAHRYTLEELSEEYDMPVSAIRRCFEGIFGRSVAYHLRMKRMNEAMRRLADTKQSIAAISMDLGYENPSKFSSAFRSCMKISPQMYRNTISQADRSRKNKAE